MDRQNYQICQRCIMDTTDVDIQFNEQGFCNHCEDYLQQKEVRKLNGKSPGGESLEAMIAKIKKDGKNLPYDCIAGVSGGTDSTYMAYLLKQNELRPLIVHLDNGWNAELAVQNIENIVKKLGFDLYTKVLNWEEFKNLQLAYLKASVLDLEALTDHAIYATLYYTAAKYNVKHIINGQNYRTEGILPLSWRYANKLTDAINIAAINKRFGQKKIKDFPLLSIEKYAYYTFVKKIRKFPILDYVPYDKRKAQKIITKKLGWRDYGGKHHESIITRFYQGYILPVKFGIDKRRAHLSTLVASGEISREAALKEMENPPLDPKILQSDLEYVPKKLGISREEFQRLMDLPPKRNEDFPTDKRKKDFLFSLKRTLLQKVK